MPLAPRLYVVLHWLSSTSRERGVPWPKLFVAQTMAVFVFFWQVDLRMALRRWEEVADQPAVPWPSRRLVGPYPFSLWSRSERRVLGPLVPEHQHLSSTISYIYITACSRWRRTSLEPTFLPASLGPHRPCRPLVGATLPRCTMPNLVAPANPSLELPFLVAPRRTSSPLQAPRWSCPSSLDPPSLALW
jgi:hypothetical protein